MRRVLTVVTAVIVCAQAGALRGQDQPTGFRASIDLIPIDVQVVDRDGRPVEGLTADSFEVTVGGDRRPVVSADFLDYRVAEVGAAAGASEPSPELPTPPATATPVAAPPPDPLPQRVFILVVDTSSLDQAAARPVVDTAAEFIGRLPPEAEVGLLAFPIGPSVDPTRDHAVVIGALDEIVGRRYTAPTGQFNLLPAEVVELSTLTQGGTPSRDALRIQAAFCPDPDDLDCPDRLASEVIGQVLLYESVAFSGIGTLQALMKELATAPLRKTVVLVSGGILSGDIPWARPDTRDLSYQVGRAAAEANASVYTLFVDQPGLTGMTAQTRRAAVVSNPARDDAVFSGWLQEFSGAAGGSMLRVSFDNGEQAFDRVLTETSAYYLLGVEPDDEDRDGRPHELEVKVRGRDVTVRSRSWVIVPRPGETPTLLMEADAFPGATGPRPPPPPVVVTPEVRALADAFEQNDLNTMARLLVAPNAAGAIRSLRENGGPWPAAPSRSAAFALDVAQIGLRTSSTFTRQAALQLLVDYTVFVRQPEPNDPFECAWLRTETAGLEGLVDLEPATILVQHAVDRCPADPRLHLALAVVNDQQLRRLENMVLVAGESAPSRAEAEARTMKLYEAAAAFEETRDEARVRAAYLSLRTGDHGHGLALLASLPAPPANPVIRYLGDLVRGRLLRAAGRSDEAVEAIRSALATWPVAQSAHVTLMTLLVSRGETDEAAALAERAQTAGPETADPWWVYWLGDYPSYAELRTRLRERME